MRFAVEGLWFFQYFYKLYGLGENRYEMKWLNYTHNLLKQVSFKANENACELENVSK